MFGSHEQNSEYHKGRARRESSPTQSQEGVAVNVHSLMQSAAISASCNAPLRAQAMQGMQQIHGNRAVQRALQTSGGTSHIAVQRSPEEDEEAEKSRKGRTTLSKVLTAGKEGPKIASAITASQAAKKETDAWYDGVNALKKGNPENAAGKWAAHEEALAASTAAKNAEPGKFGKFMEKHAGRTSPLGKVMRGSNYGLQLWQNLASGQGVGESVSGAVAGGYTNNAMTSYLFEKSPGVGVADTAINLVNAGLNLIPGMPEEVTDATQVVADATPSSFATSAVSNTARGLWNVGEGLVTGDWDSLNKQHQDILHGKSGSPLQGYGLLGKFIEGNREEWGDMTDDMRKGEYGFLPKISLKAKDWAGDKWDSAMGRGTKKQREDRENGMEHLHFEHLREARKDKVQKEQFEKEMAAISAQIEKGPAIPGTILGGPGDALSAKSILGQTPQYDEDGEEIPHVSMALPPTRRKR